MKLFVINLARAADRREFMRRQLDALKLDYEFVVGTDYREMSDDDFRTLCAPHVLAGDAYIKGVCAASISQIRAFQQMIDENLDYALICEDDAVFPHNIPEILKQLEPKLQPDEIVMLSYYSHTHDALVLSTRDPRPVTDTLTLLSPVEIDKLGSAMAYIIPKSIAAQMIKTLMPMGYALDHWGKTYHKDGFQKLRCLYPHIMEVAPVLSTIAYPAGKTLVFKLKQYLRDLPGAQWCIRAITHKKMEAKHQYRLVDAPPFTVAPQSQSRPNAG